MSNTTVALSDFAEVLFTSPTKGGMGFHDAGLMPVTQIGGVNAVGLPVHFVIDYSANGVQAFGPQGQPTTATYSSLHYKLEAYTGTAKFGHDANGTPTMSGMKNLFTVATGDLIKGQLAFTKTGGVAGEIDTTVKVGGLNVGGFNIHVAHAAGDLGSVPGGLTLSGGSTTANLNSNFLHLT